MCLGETAELLYQELGEMSDDEGTYQALSVVFDTPAGPANGSRGKGRGRLKWIPQTCGFLDFVLTYNKKAVNLGV